MALSRANAPLREPGADHQRVGDRAGIEVGQGRYHLRHAPGLEVGDEWLDVPGRQCDAGNLHRLGDLARIAHG